MCTYRLTDLPQRKVTKSMTMKERMYFGENKYSLADN